MESKIGYFINIVDCDVETAEEHDSKVKLDGAREFAEWCVQNNINFSHCEDSDCDNCTRTICRNAQTYTDIVLAEWQKGTE